MPDTPHLNVEQLLAGLEAIRRSPDDRGRLELIVRRPAVNTREVLAEGRLDPLEGLAGDRWKARPSARAPDRPPRLDTQITIMNARAIALLARDRARWPLAGDQLYVDLDLSTGNLPPGSRLAVGTAVLEVTQTPHTGCGKFVERFGIEAMKFVNSPVGRELNLRGIYARVVEAGVIRTGDVVSASPPALESVPQP